MLQITPSLSAKKYLAIALIAAIGLSAASCSPRNNSDGTPNDNEARPALTRDPITLEYWRLFDDSDVLDTFITEYQRRHPNINIEVKKIDLKPGETIYDYQANLIKLIADGAGPDLFMMHNSWLPYMINQITPMPSGILNIRDYKETFPEVVQNDFIDNNRIYAIPYTIDNLILYYNTEIFADERIKQPPKTLQELVDLVPQLTIKDNLGRIVRSAVTLGADTQSIPRAADIVATLMMQYGAELTSPDKKTATFNLPAPNSNPPYFGGREALTYYTQFANPDSQNTYTYSDATDSQGNRLLPIDIQAFIEGKSAMFIGNAYHVQNIRRFAPSGFRFDTAPMPQLRLQDPVVLANYFGETVSKTSQHPNEAWDFLRFMTSRQNQSAIAREIEAVSAHSGLVESSTNRRYYGAVAKQVPYSRSWYRNNTPEIEEIFSDMINNVLKNNLLPQTAIDTAIRDINALDS